LTSLILKVRPGVRKVRVLVAVHTLFMQIK
jgi:hypothetical protein